MNSVPALCRHCNFIFPSFIQTAGNVRIRVSNLAAICPNCGRTAEIVSGAYETINGVLTLIQSQTVSGKTLEKIKHILEYSSRVNPDPDVIIKNLKEETPELNSLMEIILRNKEDIISYLKLLVSILSLYFSYLALNDSSQNINIENINIENTIYLHNENILHNKIKNDTMKELRENPKVALKKIPTYSTCPFCESGEKYKFCCKQKIERKYKLP